MIRALWIAKTGMEGQQAKMDVISNNLANVGTTGFKRSSALFEDLMYQSLRSPGAPTADQSQLPTGLQLGLGSRVAATSRHFGQGALQQTGNSLDVAIKGHGFLQVTMPDGTAGYTRDGSLQLDAGGQLVTASGYVVQPGVTIPPGALSISVAENGTVSVTLQGQAAPQEVGRLQLTNFINPAGLEPLGQNVYIESAASGAPQPGLPGANGLGTLQQGYLEGSNVNVVEELVAMIATQRAYELNSKAIQSTDQMLQRLAQM